MANLVIIVPVILKSQNGCLTDCCKYSTTLILGDLSTEELDCDGHEDDFLLHQESWTESGARRSSGGCWRDGWGIAGCLVFAITLAFLMNIFYE